MTPRPDRPQDSLVALIVNDDAASRYVTSRILSRAGYEVVEAETGGDGLARAQQRPDVIVLDVKLPDIDGFEVCRRLKADPGTASIPVLQTSAAYVSAERRAEGLDSGADGYLVQPFEAIELVATVAALLRAHRAEDAARRSASDWQATFDAIGDGVCLLDREGRVRRCNRAMAAILGSSPAELTGRVDVLEPVLGSATSVARATSERQMTDVALRGRWYRLVADPVCTRDGSLEGLVVVAADTTDRHRLEDELRARADALAEADRRKDELLAMLAHELRNPLGAIGAALGAQETLPAGGEASARIGDTLHRQTRHLSRLVDDLLDVSRITHGKIELRRSAVDLADLVRRALAAAAPLIESRGTRVKAALPEPPVTVEADSLRLEQVIVNLVVNAAHFSPRGTVVRVSLDLAPDGAARLQVADQGMGIDAGMLQSIFDVFVQADQSPARSRGGLGIGLTMVKKLVELHGGTVTAESPGAGLGATFTVRLPLAATTAAVPAPPETKAARPSGSPRRVLLVEDNADIVELLQMQLEMWGHEVSTAFDGPSGLQQALRLRPDIAFLDVGLPGMDGYELARQIRKAEDGGRIRLVAMTGYGRPEDRDRALAAGFDAHLVKPVDAQHLQDVLDAQTLVRG
jgi:PAS domain S-box-containing protein